MGGEKMKTSKKQCAFYKHLATTCRNRFPKHGCNLIQQTLLTSLLIVIYVQLVFFC